MDFSQILIKYSTNNAAPSSLEAGELAYSELSQNLFIGTSAGPLVIGGKALVDRLTAIENLDVATIRAELTQAMQDIGAAQGQIDTLLAVTIPNLEAQLLDHQGRIAAIESTLGLGGGGAPTFTDLTITGNLVVNGTTTSINTQVTTLKDPVIALASDTQHADGQDRGVSFKRFDGASGTVKDGFFGMDATDGKFKFIPDATEVAPNNFEGDVGTIVANVEGNASTASKLANLVEISLQCSDFAPGSAADFDGSNHLQIPVTINGESEATADKLVRRDAQGGAKFGIVESSMVVSSGDVQGVNLGLSGNASLQSANLAGNLNSVGSNSKIVGFVINGGTF